jgi:L-ascorbate metabolism protein UlaG (beta-lactamase superfamily)
MTGLKMKKSTGNILMMLIVSTGLLTYCNTSPEFDEAEWYNKTRAEDSSMLYAAHAGDGTFFNPWLSQDKIKGGSFFLSRIFGTKKKYPYPEQNYSWKDNDYSYLADKNFDSISYYGHATLFIKMDGETVITDPFFSNAALAVRKKVRIKFDVSNVPDKPVILISHNHYDHLDRSSVKKLIKKDPVFIVPLGLKKFFTRLGVATVYELDWWDSVQIGGITYTFLPAQHWSRRIGQPGGKSLWGGYLIQGSRTVYFSGDTGYFCGFKEFGERYPIDYALLGAGAYDPRWFMHYSHMNVAEFFAAAGETKAKLAIPIHFGVISLSDEPLTYPLYEVDEYIRQNPEIADTIRPLRVGEYIKIE